MKHQIYLAPYHNELRQEGWIPTEISKQSKDAIYRALTLYGCNHAKYMEWYKSYYGNTTELARRMLATYAYGIENLSQFGGDMHNVIFQGYIHVTKELMAKYNDFSGNKPMKKTVFTKAKYVEETVEIVIREMTEDAMKHIAKMKGTYIEPKKEKKRRKKPDEYRIMRYADMYD